MRLITWNVSWNYEATPAERVGALANHAPDVVALQEVQQADLPGFDAVFAPLGLAWTESMWLNRGLGILVAARWPLERLADTEFRIPDDEAHLHRDPPGLGVVRVRMLSAIVKRPGAPFEIHALHVPPGSSRGWRKVDTLRGVHARLAVGSPLPRVLCGDFNEPRTESATSIETWAGKNRWSRQDPAKWAAAVHDVLRGLTAFGLVDAFHLVHGEGIVGQWSVRIRGGARRRYDHVLASKTLAPRRAEYLHEVDVHEYSDHTPAFVEFGE